MAFCVLAFLASVIFLEIKNWMVHFATLISEYQSDTSFAFSMIKSGTTKIIASMFTGCVWIMDTASVTATIINTVVPELGNDTAICITNTLVLTPGSGYVSYLWSDGSSLPTLTVNTTGLYTVTVTNACNNAFTDSIVITTLTPPPFSLGADKTICDNESFVIMAPAGFIYYNWTSVYPFTQPSAYTVQFNPPSST